MTRLHGMTNITFRQQHTFESIAAYAAFCLLVATSVSADSLEGFTEPYRQIDVAAASEAGLITEITAREGQPVKHGELLATLDIDVLEAALNVARERTRSHGRIDAAKAEVRVRRTRLDKLKELQAGGHATRGEIERAQADLAIAESNLVLAEEERRLNELECKRIEAQIDRRKIRSPIDGIVVEVHRDVGESVLISDPKLLTLVQLNPLQVRFSVSVQQSAQLRAGQVLPLVLTDLNQQAEGTVDVVSPVLDAKSGTVQVTLLIDNSDNRFRSGMRCVLQLPGQQTRTGRMPGQDFLGRTR